MRWLALVTLAGCFGAGPAPSDANDSEILFSIQPPDPSADCVVSPYVGNVAFAGGKGYVVTHGFLPPCGNNSSGDPSQPIPSELFTFPGPPAPTAELGMTNAGGQQRPHVAATATEAVWAFANADESTLTVDSLDHAVAGTFPTIASTGDPATVLFDGVTTYVAGIQTPNGPAFTNDPEFPCCGGNSSSGQPVSIFEVGSGAVAQPMLVCDGLKDCIVASSTSLFDIIAMSGFHVERRSRAAPGTAEVMWTLQSPAALAANDVRVAWASSLNFPGSQAGGGEHCEIDAAPPDGAIADAEVLLTTDRFTCLDLAVDQTSAYFTIVKLVGDHGGQHLAGIGLGRVAFDPPHELDTLDLGFVDVDAGPRQVLLDGTDIITIAPFLVARYPKSALDGAHDFAP